MEEVEKNEIIEAVPTPTVGTQEANNASFAGDEGETLESLTTRHKREQRDLQARTIVLRKTATKGDRKKKKEVTAEIAVLEAELSDRHAQELKEFELRQGPAAIPVVEIDEDDTLRSGIGALAVEEQPLAPVSTPTANGAEPAKQGKKPNRAKLRQAKKQAKLQEMRDQAEEETAGQTDKSTIENEAVSNLVRTMGLCVKDITPDGHCLYNAIADQLETRSSITKSHQELRREAASYMRKNPASFLPFLVNDNGEPYNRDEFSKYCDDVENTAMWGGQLEILALSKACQMPIHIVQTGTSTLKVSEEDYPDKDPMKISYHKHMYALGAHYNSLREA